MSSSPPPGSGTGSVSRRFEETIDKIEAELRQAIGYMNDTIVPQVRRESIVAMRKMAETLTNMADGFECRTPQPPSQPRNPQH